MNTLTSITETNPCFLCCFCKTGTVDDVKFGQLFMYDGVVTHYFCMLFSAALSQHGKDDEGILGFLPHDIMAEVRRSFRLKCTFCNATGASVGCCNKKCRTAFHFPCGLKNGASYQFFGNYESYCSDHGMLRKITLSRKEWVCPICTSQVHHHVDAIQSSCCGAAVFHKECLQKLALSSGYFFKCPMCNNGKEFVHEMRSMGIFVPEQDASWEREPNAYEDLYYQHSQCDVEDCLCPKGRTYSSQKGNWILARCRICGAAGTHKFCSSLSTVDNWACEPCLVVEMRTEKEKGGRQEEGKTEKTRVIKKIIEAGYSGQDDEALQEAYVSARSGNRRVRNGRLHNRASAKKSQWKFSDLVISPSCFWYFPYDQVRLSQFDSAKTLPDWRSLSLKVNLVNWIPKSFFDGGLNVSDNEDGVYGSKASLTSAMEGIPEEDRFLISDSEIVVEYIPKVKKKCVKFRKKKSQRKSKWVRGVIAKKKLSKKIHLLDSKVMETKQESQCEEMVEEATSSTASANITPTPAAVKIRLKKKITTSITPISPGSQWVIDNPEQVLSNTVLQATDDNMSASTVDTLPLRRSSRNMKVEPEDNIDTAGEAEMQEIWTDDAFVIDVQSNVEISPFGLEYEKTENISLYQNIEFDSFAVPAQEKELLHTSNTYSSEEVEMEVVVTSTSEADSFPIPISPSQVLNEIVTNYSEQQEDHDVEWENNVEKPMERLDMIATLNNVDTKKEDLLPLTELNTDAGSGLSQTKYTLLIPSQAQKESIQKEDFLDDIETKLLHGTHVRIDHPYCKKPSGSLDSMNSGVSEPQPNLLLSKELSSLASVT